MGVKKSIDFTAWMPHLNIIPAHTLISCAMGLPGSQIAHRLPSAYNMSKGEKPDEKR